MWLKNGRIYDSQSRSFRSGDIEIAGERIVSLGAKAPGDAEAIDMAGAFLLPGFLGLAAFLILPLVASLLLSFSNWQVIGRTRFVGLANYVNLFTRDPIFWSVFRVTLLYTAEYLILNIVISLGMALWDRQSVLGQAVVPLAVLSADIHAADRHRPGLAVDADPRRYR